MPDPGVNHIADNPVSPIAVTTVTTDGGSIESAKVWPILSQICVFFGVLLQAEIAWWCVTHTLCVLKIYKYKA